MNLQLPLTKEWFDLTKSGVKKEDYRELTPYWVKRLILIDLPNESKDEGKTYAEDIVYDICINKFNPNEVLQAYWASFKPFENNIMTHGYPSKKDRSKFLTYRHNGIEIRTGNPDWGAEEGKMYFVIKHGKKY